MANGDDQLDVVQHPKLGPLKFPKAMPFAERNQLITELEQKGAAPAATTPQAAPQRESLGKTILHHIITPLGGTEEIIGMLKGAGTTIQNLAGETPIFNIIGPPLTRAGKPRPSAQQTPLQQLLGPDALKPQGTGQKLGYGVESIAEFLVPGSKIAKGAEAAVSTSKTINAVLGVTRRMIRVGSEPAAKGLLVDAGRGLKKEGFSVVDVLRSNPAEFVDKVNNLRHAAGAAIDAALLKTPGKVDLIEIADKVQQTAAPYTTEVTKVLTDAFSNSKLLSSGGLRNLVPYEARVVQRELDKIARFDPRYNVAAKLRSAISAETDRLNPALSKLDEHYGDLNAAFTAAKTRAQNAAAGIGLQQVGSQLKRGAIRAAEYGTLYGLYRHLFGGHSEGGGP